MVKNIFKPKNKLSDSFIFFRFLPSCRNQRRQRSFQPAIDAAAPVAVEAGPNSVYAALQGVGVQRGLDTQVEAGAGQRERTQSL